jgi:hypothetical protein
VSDFADPPTIREPDRDLDPARVLGALGQRPPTSWSKLVVMRSARGALAVAPRAVVADRLRRADPALAFLVEREHVAPGQVLVLVREQTMARAIVVDLRGGT